MKDIVFEPTTFRPDEAEVITGVNVILQRNWRRAGYLPKTRKGMARFEIETTADMLAKGKLAERGIPPSTSTRIAKSAATLMMLFAQDCPGAIDDTTGRAIEKPIKFLPASRKRFLLAYGKTENKFWFENDLTSFYAKKLDADLTAAIVLDLQRLAETLCARAGRPLWKAVEVD